MEPERKLVIIKYYLSEGEAHELQKMAYYMHEHKAIPRPTVGAFAKAASFKWFNEINERLKREINAKAS
jgi:hypothetical protein